jgi:hypothetical protein
VHAAAGPVAIDVYGRQVDAAQLAVEQPADVRVAVVGAQRELEVLVGRERPAVVLRTDVVLALGGRELALGILGQLVEAHLFR